MVKRRTLRVIRIFSSPLNRQRGRIKAGPLDLPCALGRGGTTRAKREGDGGTPVGRLRIVAVRYRPDRSRRPPSSVPVTAIRPTDGWCDDPGSRLYNRPVRLPAPVRHERLWRDDGLYDVVVDLDWNRRPARKGRGSAIFLHVGRPSLAPTEGCVAVPRHLMSRLVKCLGTRTILHVVR